MWQERQANLKEEVNPYKDGIQLLTKENLASHAQKQKAQRMAVTAAKAKRTRNDEINLERNETPMQADKDSWKNPSERNC